MQGQIWDISVQNLGPVYVGPYRQLTQFLAERGLSSGPHRYEAAHIANWEHLKDVGSPYSKGRAPAVAVPADMHARWTSETARVQKEWHGGRETPTHVRAEVTRGEVISVHHHLYEAHPELRRIAANVFREDRVGPAPKGGKAAAGGGTPSPGGAGKAPPPAGGATTPFAAALSKRLLGKAKVARIPPRAFRSLASRAARSGAALGADIALLLLKAWGGNKIVERAMERKRDAADALLRSRLHVALDLAIRHPRETVYGNATFEVQQWTSYVGMNEREHTPIVVLGDVFYDTEPLPFVTAGPSGPILTGERSGFTTHSSSEVDWSEHGVSIPLYELLREADPAARAEFEQAHDEALSKQRAAAGERSLAHYAFAPREDPPASR